MKPAIASCRDGELHVYQIPNILDQPVPVTVYPIEADEEVLSQAAAPDLIRIVYSTRNKMRCLGQDGGLLWCYDISPHTTERLPRTECIFSLDGLFVWLYRPDAMTSRGPDRLVVLRADTGEVVAQVELDTVGQGGLLVPHSDGRHVMFDVGEGQDGVRLFCAALADSGINLYSYPWDDRALIDIASDGQLFMTVDHGRYDVAFHAFPSGEVVRKLSVTALGSGNYDDDDDGDDDEDDPPLIDWSGGFLNSDIAVVVITGELDDKEWHHYYEVDLRTGKPLGRFDAHVREGDNFIPLGDGTWIVSGLNGHPQRKSRTSPLDTCI
ncbi:hypothetical protein N7462_006877 [Penicillium macrosclerotiorum]|uniref:uncharacterized protein n=1 Tax=Penicillium macrosclerotiorum TaxID=303699 RepID=UPI00254823F8|nr:uncharacterized protein N7462_006877 [Penicillium macrosclerotiorum]KAJ5678633.1 hypothetical protein N7462_006877 [Penicillium macrosclerotiorum]